MVWVFKDEHFMGYGFLSLNILGGTLVNFSVFRNIFTITSSLEFYERASPQYIVQYRGTFNLYINIEEKRSFPAKMKRL